MKTKLGFIGSEEMYNNLLKQPTASSVDISRIDIEREKDNRLDYDYILIRSTKEKIEDIRSIILNNPHIDYLDNISRFFDDVGKRRTSWIRSEDGTGAKVLTKATEDTEFPIILKPVNGRKCRGIIYCNSYQEYEDKQISTEDYIIESKLDLIDEFRVLMLLINNKCEYFITRKKKVSGVKNTRIDKEIDIAEEAELLFFLRKYRRYKKGITGYDIGLTSSGVFKIIEENRAPVFKRVEKYYNISVLDIILKMIL